MYRENARKEEKVKLTLTYDEVRNIVAEHLKAKNIIGGKYVSTWENCSDQVRLLERELRLKTDMIVFEFDKFGEDPNQ